MESATVPLNSDSVRLFLACVAPQTRSILTRYHIPHSDREDLVQEALIATVYRWQEINNKAGWFLVSLRNVCCAHQRRSRCWDRLVNVVDPDVLRELASAQAPPQEQFETICDLRSLLGELEVNDRQVLYLRFVENLGPTEIASRVGCHPANVRKVACRALARLKIVATIPPPLRIKRIKA